VENFEISLEGKSSRPPGDIRSPGHEGSHQEARLFLQELRSRDIILANYSKSAVFLDKMFDARNPEDVGHRPCL
jgi:hypothetical protein